MCLRVEIIIIMDMSDSKRSKSSYFDSFKHLGFLESLAFKDVKNY